MRYDNYKQCWILGWILEKKCFFFCYINGMEGDETWGGEYTWVYRCIINVYTWNMCNVINQLPPMNWILKQKEKSTLMGQLIKFKSVDYTVTL